MKPLVVIPARGGSKGVPRKNIKELGGKSLIYYTIEAAREVFEDKYIMVSTDDEEIKEVVERTGLKVPFLRPQELATDEAGTHEVLLHAIKFSEGNGYFPDTLILLQPTSPFRTGEHIKEALNLYHNELDMVVSVKETKSNPYYVLFEENEEGYLRKSKEGDFTRRQDVPKVWEINGAIYIINIESIKNKEVNRFECIKKYVMDYISSIDIDDKLDFQIASLIKLN
ncbi:acylneuraminate cytidylyltransferase family protein [Marivirga arenosa]|uniref:Acylneuraminate cytidylyltransferase family protein n=1 Tax=Marivirga arenosa TaxID=3059076 RepID=A0AA49JHW8_9BACT|nr:acylneuraminate cytidylyltransferase family protein [Marivirga sp. BKB1-2]WKK83342.2 acylneuraminate cytidylyltransferase family protein [Marivirga sp. BKB1-2]